MNATQLLRPSTTKITNDADILFGNSILKSVIALIRMKIVCVFAFISS